MHCSFGRADALFVIAMKDQPLVRDPKVPFTETARPQLKAAEIPCGAIQAPRASAASISPITVSRRTSKFSGAWESTRRFPASLPLTTQLLPLNQMLWPFFGSQTSSLVILPTSRSPMWTNYGNTGGTTTRFSKQLWSSPYMPARIASRLGLVWLQISDCAGRKHEHGVSVILGAAVGDLHRPRP
jgi:hypothetical protein